MFYVIEYPRPFGPTPVIYTKKPDLPQDDEGPWAGNILEFKSESEAQEFLQKYYGYGSRVDIFVV